MQEMGGKNVPYARDSDKRLGQLPKRSSGFPLNSQIQSSWERLLAFPLGWVRINASRTNRAKLESKGRIAETNDGIIRLPNDIYPPRTKGSLAILGHEVAHVVQQANAKSEASTRQLEEEAVIAGRMLAAGRTFQISLGAKNVKLARPLSVPPGTRLATLILQTERWSIMRINLFSVTELVPPGEAPGGFAGFSNESTAMRFAAADSNIVAIIRDSDEHYHAYRTNVRAGATPVVGRLTDIGSFDVTELVNQPLQTEEAGEGQVRAEESHSPNAILTGYLRQIMGHNQIQPPDWDNIWRRATELSIDESGVSRLLTAEPLNMDADSANLIAFISMSANTAIQALAQAFSTSITAGPPRTLELDPVTEFITLSLQNDRLEAEEVRALRQFCHIMQIEYVETVLNGLGLNGRIENLLVSVLRFPRSEFQNLLSHRGILPLDIPTITSSPHELLQRFIRQGHCSHAVLSVLRAILVGRSLEQASSILQSAGLISSHANLLARQFIQSEHQYQHQVEERILLTMSFQPNDGGWELTPESHHDWTLPWHSELVRALTPYESGRTTEQGVCESTRDLGQITFASGVTRDAYECSYRFQGSVIRLTVSEDIWQDLAVFNRIDNALRVIPPEHLALVNEVYIDPGNEPGGASADASRRGYRINLYLRGAGPNVPQNQLNYTAAHEVGHLVSFRSAETNRNFWDQWEQAMGSDGIGISRYGFTNRREDFAESYVSYLAGGRGNEGVRREYSHRFTLLDSLFGG